MAVPRLQCGKCGGTLAIGQNVCPHCGEPVEGVQTAVRISCPVCGHSNAAGSAVCSSCGARLGEKRKRGSRGSKPSAAPSPGKRIEPWQVASVVAVVGLIAFVVYLEWGSGGRAPAPATVPGTTPAMPEVHTHAPDLAPLEAAVAADPSDGGALLRLANGQHDAGRYTEAIATYGRYLRMKPKDPDARVDMGICYFEMARMDTTGSAVNYLAAVREMRTALEHAPTHQPAAFNLGVVYLTMGDLQESRTWLTKAAAMNAESELGKRARTMLEQHSF